VLDFDHGLVSIVAVGLLGRRRTAIVAASALQCFAAVPRREAAQGGKSGSIVERGGN
jgi:hypothetical protein